MHSVYYEAEALVDVDDRYHHYESEQTGLGERFRRVLNKRIDLILSQPRAFGIIRGSVRMAKIPKFPEIIFFRVKRKVVVVAAVIHGRRDPNYIRKRLS